MIPAMQRRLLTINAAARMLGMNADELRALVRSEQVPHVVLPGGQLRFDRIDLWAFIAARKRPVPA